MFWFTTPTASSETPAPLTPVKQAVRSGAAKTGVKFDYLLKTAERESALNPQAKAPSSSAKGLFQFIEQTWFSMVRSQGDKHGLGDYAKAISQRSDGRLSVDDPAMKQKILDLRTDPELSSVMAGEYTQKNGEHLASVLGRKPTDGELYAAHFLGAKGASELIQATQNNPTQSAASVFPDAASSNRSIFYDKSGRARAVSEVYAVLTTPRGQNMLPQAEQDTAISRTPTVRDNPNEPAMFSLFRTEGRRGPVSEAVAKLWSGQRAKGIQTASLEANPYFPRGDDSAASIVQTSKVHEAVHAYIPPKSLHEQRIEAPLPPIRDESIPSLKSRTGQNEPEASVVGQRSRMKVRKPLDLSQFMVWRPS
jgi:hypothetical protein